jgi:regulator of protease activity HflC (stomatin/prohibitin superfamily)
MLTMKYVLMLLGVAFLLDAAAILFYDLYWQYRPVPSSSGESLATGAKSTRWKVISRLTIMGTLVLLVGISIQVIPSGKGGVRISQVSGTLPGTLYPGAHWCLPLVQGVALYNLRDSIFQTAASPDPKKKLEVLKVQTKEGLSVGLTVAVRYRLDPNKLSIIHANLPQPVEEELVPPIVSSVFRQVAPLYMVKELFATRREEVLQKATGTITQKLAEDGLIVKEVLVRDIQLPAEYAKGMEGLLLKEQENERLGVEMEVKQKMVRTAELEAEAEKVRRVKEAEGQAAVTVLHAKAQADAMQHTLPLKEKQIQQTRLEAEARKESTVKNAEAAAQAKVIDGRAELERLKLMAEAEDNRIRRIASADAERMKMEAQVLKQNPLLIQKIVAERLSDKVQIMMVPTDGKFFFASDVLRGNLALNTEAVQEK